MARKRLPGARRRATRMAAKRAGRDFGRRLIRRLGFSKEDFKAGGIVRKKLGLFGESFSSGAAGPGPAPSTVQPERVSNESSPSLTTIVKQLNDLVKTANKVGILTKGQQEALLSQLTESRRISKEQLLEGKRGAPIPESMATGDGNSLAPLGDVINELKKQIDKLTNTVEEKADDQGDESEGDAPRRGFLERLADRYDVGDDYRRGRGRRQARRERAQRVADRTARTVGGQEYRVNKHGRWVGPNGRFASREVAETLTRQSAAPRGGIFGRMFGRRAAAAGGGSAARAAAETLTNQPAARGGLFGRMFGRGAAATGGAAASTSIAQNIGRSVARNSTTARVAGPAIEAAVKKAAAPIIAKGLGSTALKSIPILGGIAGVGFAINRLVKGDVVGAGLDLASGLGGAFTAIPALILSTARDVYKSVFGVQPEADPEVGSRMAMVTSIIEGLVKAQISNSVRPKNRPTQARAAEAVVPAAPPQQPPRESAPPLAAVPTPPAATAPPTNNGGSTSTAGAGSAPAAAPASAAPPAGPSDGATRVDSTNQNTGTAVIQASQQPDPVVVPNMYGFNQQLGRYTPQTSPTTKSGNAGIGNVPNPDYVPSGTNNLAAMYNVMFFSLHYQEL